MTSLQDLLPDPDSSPFCADFSRSLDLDPGGTAIRADRVVLIETPLPWPKPVFDHALLAGVQSKFENSEVTTRVLAATPQDEPANTSTEVGGETISVHVFDRNVVTTPAQVDHYQFRVSAESLLSLVEQLAAHQIGGVLTSGLTANLHRQAPLESPVVLICTQGSHDICCGSKGMRFANEAQAVADASVSASISDTALVDTVLRKALIFRVSHTGGHRFAPTAMTLPDGRMWADLTVEKLEQIFARSEGRGGLVGSCRGWWGAARGPAQMAERAVFAEIGWELGSHRSVQILNRPSEDDPASQQLWRVEVDDSSTDAGLRVWEVAMSIGRRVPTISCHSPGGLPAKPSIEYQIDSVRQVK